MRLKAIKYIRFKNEKNEWSIEGKPINNKYNQSLTINQINLIVGKNATGKTNTINAIRTIADLISGDKKLSSLVYNTFKYDLLFEDNFEDLLYTLDVKKGEVVQEILKIGKVEKLNRAKGELFYELENKNLSFQTDKDILAISRRDSKQQPFFESIYNWGKTLNHYKFGGLLGKETFLKEINSTDSDKELNLKDTNKVTGVLIKGQSQFKDTFISAIIEDMHKIGYPLKTIDTRNLKYIPLNILGLAVQENDLDDYTDQDEMSQGMFRALSLIIQLNYSLFTNNPSCILIDDIGEGLDFERSKSLIELIIAKSEKSSVQVLMTTNDRFVMNKIPLQYWSLIKREKHKSIFYNYQNSKDTFDEFSLTGLNNFEFFSSDFYIHGFDDFTKDVKK